MNKSIYNYYSWFFNNYLDQVVQASTQGDCILDYNYASKLEKIYEQEKYSNLELQQNIDTIQGFVVREKTNMLHVVKDYKNCYNIS